MKIREIINQLETFAPLALQESFDNAGVQISSDKNEEVRGVLLALDVTEKVIEEAKEKKCNLIISHHPLIFSARKKITNDDYVGRCILEAVRSGITVYAAHTNLDNARGGVNYKMAEKMGLLNLEFLASLTPKDATVDGGSGVIGELRETMTRDSFIDMLRCEFGAECARYNDAENNAIKRVALCGGAGAFLIPEAVRKNADAFVTGEIGYHHFFGLEKDILLVELGHYETEQYTLDIIEDIVKTADEQTRVLRTEQRTNPVMYATKK